MSSSNVLLRTVEYHQLGNLITPVEKLEVGMLILEGRTFNIKGIFNQDTKVGLRRILKIIESEPGILTTQVIFQVVGLLQVQENKKTAKPFFSFFGKKGTSVSETKEIVTAFFDRNYIERYDQEGGYRNIYENFQTFPDSIDLEHPNPLYQIEDLDSLNLLIPKKKVPIEFKVKV